MGNCFYGMQIYDMNVGVYGHNNLPTPTPISGSVKCDRRMWDSQ